MADPNSAADGAGAGAGAEVDRSSTRMLVTGGTGFISLHCLHLLLRSGYRVRTTVRSAASRSGAVRAALQGAWAEPALSDALLDARLEFADAELLSDDGWAEALAGCDFVWHVASPVPMSEPKDADTIIKPAREGTLRVLRAAAAAKRAGTCKVSRIVVTSSVVAVRNGWPAVMPDKTFTESDWAIVDAPGMSAYAKSKVISEKAAWEWADTEGKELGIELVTVNPGAVYGPPLAPAQLTVSTGIVKSMLDGTMPVLTPFCFCVVDVRDVAALHLLATFSPRANGQRYLAITGDPLSLADIARVLREGLARAANDDGEGEEAEAFRAHAAKAPTRVMPGWLARVLSYVVRDLRVSRAEMFATYHASSEKARSELGWTTRSNEEAIIATAKALIQAKVI